MTGIQLLKEHTTRDGKWHRVGEILILDDAVAADLIREGIAKERVKPGPKETKKADQKTKAAEPEPEEPEEEEPF